MLIQKAELAQFPAVRAFYDAVIDGIGGARDSADWKKGIYPTEEFLLDSVRRGELYTAGEDGAIVGAMVLNHQFNDEYRAAPWPTQAEDVEVTVIHILAVHPSYTGRGYGKDLVRFAVDRAREERQKAIRLDVLKGNRRAEKLYTGMGFRYVGTLPMYYEDTGRTEFDLYEYLL